MVCGHCLVTLSITVNETLKWLSSLPILIIIIMYIYHALINVLSAHMIHINLNMILYTHVEHSSTQTTYTKHHTEKQTTLHPTPPPHEQKTTMNSGVCIITKSVTQDRYKYYNGFRPTSQCKPNSCDTFSRHTTLPTCLL